MDFKMNAKICIVLIALIGCGSCALLRTPKVYNALITTDQNLTPSRAYPVIQPTIHETPYFYPPYLYNGFGPYGFYDPYAFSPFGNQQDFIPKYNTAVDSAGSVINTSRQNGNAIASVATAASAASAATAAADRSIVDVADSEKLLANNLKSSDALATDPSTENSPIPLNEFGLPPSLIQISPISGNNPNPINLAPFGYNSYPLIYDQYSGFQQGPYLPHFGVLPQTSYANLAGNPTANSNINANNNNHQRQNKHDIGAGSDGVGIAVGGGGGGGVGGGVGPVSGSSNTEAVNTGSFGGASGQNERVNSGFSGEARGSGQSVSDTVYYDRENRLGQGQASSSGNFIQNANLASDVQSNQGGLQGQSASSSSLSSSSLASSSTALSSSGVSQSSGSSVIQSNQLSDTPRLGRVFYFNENIKNNKNRNENIADVPPPPLPFGARSNDDTK